MMVTKFKRIKKGLYDYEWITVTDISSNVINKNVVPNPIKEDVKTKTSKTKKSKK